MHFRSLVPLQGKKLNAWTRITRSSNSHKSKHTHGTRCKSFYICYNVVKKLVTIGLLIGHSIFQVFHKRMPPEAVDLVSRLLQYSPNLRCTAVSKWHWTNVPIPAFSLLTLWLAKIFLKLLPRLRHLFTHSLMSSEILIPVFQMDAFCHPFSTSSRMVCFILVSPFWYIGL